MAAITRKRFSSRFFASYRVFAVVVSIFVYAEMVSAWQSICVPGDIYMDSQTDDIIMPVCSNCTTWCESECSKLKLSKVKDTDKCNTDDPSGTLLKCKCCCEKRQLLFPPQKPIPPYANEFDGPEPQNFPICVGNQTSQTFEHPDGNDCIDKPECEKSCNDKGLSKARSECVAKGTLDSLTWYEQCCCEKPPPCEANCSLLSRLVCVVRSSCKCCSKSTDGGRGATEAYRPNY
ncbi:hypothetical protein C5167_025799 [Papaver somniferum]|uniref:Uncharacterized protein n=1 Tax=Papaver somniferum TaxID=3469 RepID=A0A4Y7JVG9_PAPSO|nr:uncharacterized protein LOC113278541 [Papaver somniferum]RZC64050.1 hypothetical protein C5167_025799 [Papaver somniferum]